MGGRHLAAQNGALGDRLKRYIEPYCCIISIFLLFVVLSIQLTIRPLFPYWQTWPCCYVPHEKAQESFGTLLHLKSCMNVAAFDRLCCNHYDMCAAAREYPEQCQ